MPWFISKSSREFVWDGIEKDVVWVSWTNNGAFADTDTDTDALIDTQKDRHRHTHTHTGTDTQSQTNTHTHTHAHNTHGTCRVRVYLCPCPKSAARATQRSNRNVPWGRAVNENRKNDSQKCTQFIDADYKGIERCIYW